MLILKFIGIIVLSLLATQVFMIIFLGSLERFTIWLYTRHPTRIARLRESLKLPSQNTTNQRTKGRQDSKYEAWCIKCFEKAYQWIHPCERGSSSLIRKTNINPNGNCQNNPYPNEYPNTVKVGFLHLGHIKDRTAPTFSQSHIKNIVARLRKLVNQSGKEPKSCT